MDNLQNQFGTNIFFFKFGPCGGLSTSIGTAPAVASAASAVASSVGEDAVDVDEEDEEASMLAAIPLKTRRRDLRSSLRIPATNRSLLWLFL